MKKIPILIFLFLLVSAKYLFAQPLNIIPMPQSVEMFKGFFTISHVTVIIAKNNLNSKPNN
jgi:hypothetical protein